VSAALQKNIAASLSPNDQTRNNLIARNQQHKTRNSSKREKRLAIMNKSRKKKLAVGKDRPTDWQLTYYGGKERKCDAIKNSND